MISAAVAPGLAAARAQFDANVTYLNTATVGLPPRRAWDALQVALTDWRAGAADPAAYDVPVDAARAAFARLVGVDIATVAIGSQVSVFAGLVAASLPEGSEVLVASGDFSSITFPFRAQAERGVRVRTVALERIVDEIAPRTTLVSVSAVQSANGRIIDVEALQAACASTGTRVLLDITQAAGWLPVDASRFDYTVCAAYKWLLSPRGACFFTVAPEHIESLVPHTAGWYGGAEPWSSIYPDQLTLAPDARRFNVSPAWHAWIGTAPAVELLAELGTAALHRHSVGLAERFRAAVGMAPSNSAIVSLSVADGATAAMREARIVAAVRAERLRLSFHVSTDKDDVDHAAAVLRPFVRGAA